MLRTRQEFEHGSPIYHTELLSITPPRHPISNEMLPSVGGGKHNKIASRVFRHRPDYTIDSIRVVTEREKIIQIFQYFHALYEWQKENPIISNGQFNVKSNVLVLFM